MEIVDKIKKLGLPFGQYVVFGSVPLDVHGIRKAKDIDIAVTEDLFNRLRLDNSWEEKTLIDDLKPLKKDNVEICVGWYGCPGYRPDLQHLIDTAEIIDGVPFANLDEVVLWKTAMGREKDLEDLKLISNYRERNALNSS